MGPAAQHRVVADRRAACKIAAFCVLESLPIPMLVALARAARRQLNPGRWAHHQCCTPLTPGSYATILPLSSSSEHFAGMRKQIMGTAHFPIPDELERILILLAPSNNFSVHTQGDTFLVLTGDQLAFAARSLEEVHAFLCGAFLVTYGGQRLANIDRPIDPVRADADSQAHQNLLRLRASCGCGAG
jgi:hypothetical protein